MRSETRSDPSRGRETAAPSTQPRFFKGSCSQGFEEMKLRRSDTVDDRHSESNARTERTQANSSVKPEDPGKRPNSPSKVHKGPDKGGGQLEKHPMGATSCERSKTM
jgi:hypothetical protein